jgi:hypothetical protein
MNEGTAMSHQFRTMSAALVSLTMLTGPDAGQIG